MKKSEEQISLFESYAQQLKNIQYAFTLLTMLNSAV